MNQGCLDSTRRTPQRTDTKGIHRHRRHWILLGSIDVVIGGTVDNDLWLQLLHRLADVRIVGDV